MVVTLGQQCHVGEKLTVTLYTYINRHAVIPEKKQKQKQKQCSTTSNMVVIIYCFIECNERVSTWYLNGFPALGQQYNVGEKPTVILYTYINRHADPPSVTKQKTTYYIVKMAVMIYDKRAIEPYTNIGAWVNNKMSYNYIDRHAGTSDKTKTKT